MNINEAATGVVDHILHHFKVGQVDHGKYVKDLHKEFGWMTGEQFKDLCFEVAKRMEPYKPPQLGFFDKVCKELASSKGWNRPIPQRVAAPAPKPTTAENHEIMLKDIRAMKPRSARATLRQAKDQGITFPDEIRAALEAKANEPETEIITTTAEVIAATSSPAPKPKGRLTDLRERREKVRAIVACPQHNNAEWRRVLGAVASYHAHHCDDCMDLLIREVWLMGEAPEPIQPKPPNPTPVLPPLPPKDPEERKAERMNNPNVAHLTEAEKKELDEGAEREGVPF